MKDSMSIGSGLTKYPMSGHNLTGSFLSLKYKASFKGNKWCWKRTWRVLAFVSPGSREVTTSSMGTSIGTSVTEVKEPSVDSGFLFNSSSTKVTSDMVSVEQFSKKNSTLTSRGDMFELSEENE
uniref:Uncharacterized protein MANES_04G070300 n=1 Tax=Rhizophora mucronata TaxID=61149 RepID=A0A2P2JSS5_RHIMU